MTAKPLNVLLDGFNLALEKGTGVATYGRNLSFICRDLGFQTGILYGRPGVRAKSDLLTEVRFFDPHSANASLPPVLDALNRVRPRLFGNRTHRVPVRGEVILNAQRAQLPHFDELWNSPDLYRIAEARFWLAGTMTNVRHAERVDIAHWTYPLPVRVPGAVNVYTMHDLVPLRLPYTTLDNKAYYLRLMRKLVETADHIVTVSQTSRDDIIRLLDCPAEKVTNTYQSVEIPRRLLDKNEDQVRAEVEGAFGLPYKGYLLFFGAIEPKKNVGRLIEAYVASGVEMPLVLIGSKAWKSEQELRLLQRADRPARAQTETATSAVDRVFHFDYAPFSLLVSAIRGARATIFPSLYEGFGLPVLESMVLGTPVVTSGVGATAEIAGEAALLVNPYDPADIAAAMRAVASDDELAGRLSRSGLAQAERFSPRVYAERMKTLYGALAQSGGVISRSREETSVL
ncbi:MAG: glycosyltransferase family 4 protein [Beijerinckiaceae bacterium]